MSNRISKLVHALSAASTAVCVTPSAWVSLGLTGLGKGAYSTFSGLERVFAASASPSAWVFLGPPGVGKGTYSKRIAESLGMSHIAAGDLVRDEIKRGTTLGKEMQEVVNSGQLLSDSLILKVLRQRMVEESSSGVTKFLLDGFPRTAPQAQALDDIVDVQLAVNLDLREDVLVDKCLGRRLCSKCGGNFNVADINVPTGEHGESAIVMPPLNPPDECLQYMEQRDDDNTETILKRLEVYKASAKPVEDFYADRGMLIDYEITGGIPETLPRLMDTLRPHIIQMSSSEAEVA